MKEKLKELLTESRYIHSLNVAECALKLAKIYNVDKDKVYKAALLHDCGKCLSHEQVDKVVKKNNIKLDEFEKDNRALSHAIIGVYVAKNEFGITDNDILNAIKYHTTGRAKMSLIEKIIYIADLIEKDRKFEGVEELRNLVFKKELDKAILSSLNNTIKIVIKRNQMIHPRTIEARNYLTNKIY